MTDDGYTYRDEDFPMGLRCPECGHTFVDGEPFSTTPVAFQDDIPVSRVVCSAPECVSISLVKLGPL